MAARTEAIDKGIYASHARIMIGYASQQRLRSVSDEVRKRVVRVVANGGIFLVMLTVTSIVLPDALLQIRQIPVQGLSYRSAAGLLLVIIMSFLGLRVLMDLIRLVDLTSDFLILHIPGLRKEKRVSVVRAFKELMVVVVLIVAATSLSPFLLLVRDIGFWLDIDVSLSFAGVSVILIYDAGRTLYAIFQSGIELLLDKISVARAKSVQEKDLL